MKRSEGWGCFIEIWNVELTIGDFIGDSLSRWLSQSNDKIGIIGKRKPSHWG